MGDRVEFAYEGQQTNDGRTIMPGALNWRELPLPVFRQTNGLVQSMVRVGNIVELERVGDTIIATMDIDMPAGFVLSLDGQDAEIEYQNFDEQEGLNIVFKSMRVVGGVIIPRDIWAWKEEDENGTE